MALIVSSKSTRSVCAITAGGLATGRRKFYRWLTMNFDEDLGGMATIRESRRERSPGGFIAHKGRPFLHIVKVDVQTEFVGAQQLTTRSR